MKVTGSKLGFDGIVAMALRDRVSHVNEDEVASRLAIEAAKQVVAQVSNIQASDAH